MHELSGLLRFRTAIQCFTQGVPEPLEGYAPWPELTFGYVAGNDGNAPFDRRSAERWPQWLLRSAGNSRT
jgi:hypothetical protein